jgi:hypothetical protein
MNYMVIMELERERIVDVYLEKNIFFKQPSLVGIPT